MLPVSMLRICLSSVGSPFTRICGTTFLLCRFPLVGFLIRRASLRQTLNSAKGCEGEKEKETAVRLARIIRHVGDYYTLSGFTTPGGREGEAMQWTAQSEVYIQIIACDD